MNSVVRFITIENLVEAGNLDKWWIRCHG
jgi:hypothetical protein